MGFSLRDCCVILLVDSGYVEGAQVLLSSFRRSEILPNLPLILMSDDQAVLDQPYLAYRASQTILLGDDFLDRFIGTPRDIVPQRHQREKVPKYTWLKFAAYRDYGYASNIFIDADMMLLSSPDPVLQALENRDFDYAAAPSVARATVEEIPLGRFESGWKDLERAHNPTSFADLSRDEMIFNSGFFVVRGRPLQPDYIDKLFEIAKNTESHYEQHMNRIALQQVDAKFYELPITMNMTRPIYDRAIESGHADLCERAIIQHYTLKKPWNKKPRDYLPSDALWHEEWLHFFRQHKLNHDRLSRR